MGLLRESTQRLDGLLSLLPTMSESPVVDLHPIAAVLAATSARDVLAYFKAVDEFWLISIHHGEISLHKLAATPERIG